MSAHVAVTAEALDADSALRHCSTPGHGAADLFVGRVRDINDGRQVLAVSYDLHAPLCRKVFAEICAEAQREWGEDTRLWLVHRHGRLVVGEASVIAGASSRHRDASFRACRYLIEELKQRAPIWKQEHYVDGDAAWSRGHALRVHG
jgi:molybdopterin synthase catalytic subunit